MNIEIRKLIAPTPEIAAAFDKWENDPALIPFIRPNRCQADLDRRETVTIEVIQQRLLKNEIYVIFNGKQPIGEMNYKVDPDYLFKKETGTAWIGINIGEKSARGKGIGMLAMQYLEEQIRAASLERIELGVFEFNTQAIKLYQKVGYREIGRINDFAFWQDRLWQDIRMEKYLE